MPLPITGLIAFARSPIAKYIGITLAVAGAAWGGYHAIYSRGVSSCERVHAEALAEHIQRAQAQATEIALQDAEFSEAYEIYRTRYVTKVEEVIREIPTDCAACRLSPNGLSLINAARSGGLPMAPNPGQPDATVPTPSTPQNGNVPGIRWRNLDGHPSVQRLRGETLATDPSGGETGI